MYIYIISFSNYNYESVLFVRKLQNNKVLFLMFN